MSHSVETFFDQATYTLTYVVFNSSTKDCIIIDPVLDYDQASSKVSFNSIEKVSGFVQTHALKVLAILETHAHADHLSGAIELKKLFPQAVIGIGKNITKVQSVFKSIYNLDELQTDGSQFDLLLTEDKLEKFGTIEVKTIFTPGHTPACSSYLIDDMLFVGDALFMPDYGTGRCDFPAGSAGDLYHSVHDKLYQLPDETRVYTCHDYQPGGRELKFQSTIGEQKKTNIQLAQDTTEADYIAFRTKRDATLSVPKLLLPSIQVNIDAGNLPKAEQNDVSYLKIPISKDSLV